MNASMLLISVVRRGRGDRVVAIAREAGATGSTVFFGRGTAKNKWLQMLCLADTEKEIVFTIASTDLMVSIISALKSAPNLCRNTPGIGFTLNVAKFIRCGAARTAGVEGEEKMSADSQRQLICVIANEGYADDIMMAARKAGAKGGTIIRARGTGTEEDSNFFGIKIVPEKEMVMILAKNVDSPPIIDAVLSCPCLADPGVGIMFCLPVVDFFPLGKQANNK